MHEEGIRPNELTLVTVLKACCMCLDGEFEKQVHGEIVKLRLFTDVHVASAFVDLYAKCGELEYAENVCLLMPEQNSVSWNVLLNGFAQVGDVEQVFRLFCRMEETELKFDECTLCSILKGCASSGNLKGDQLVHGIAIKIGYADEEFVSCSLVDLYSKCALADDAFKVFSSIKSRDIVTWSAMICCFEHQGREQKVAELFQEMMSVGLRPNQFTLASIVCAAEDVDDLSYSRSLLACVYNYGFETETFDNNALIKMYIKNGSVTDCSKIFNGMSQRDIVSWNVLLSGFHDGESCDEGPRIFKELLGRNFAFISTLRFSTSLSNLKFRKQLHAQIIKARLDADFYVGAALINMYANTMKDVIINMYANTMKDVKNFGGKFERTRYFLLSSRFFPSEDT